MLISLKETRTRQQNELYKSLKKFCRRADTYDYQLFQDVNEKIYTEGELSNLRQALADLYDKIMMRQETVNELQVESKKICEIIGSTCVLPDPDQELIDTDCYSSTSVLSEEVIERLEMINLRLKEEHDAWMETVAERYDDLLAKTNELAKKCCRGAISRPSGDKQTSATALKKLESNYQDLQEKYERGGPIFDKLNEWLALWQERLNSEQRACRTSFYNNRGGSLNTTLKRQKYLQVHIPQVFNELCKLTEKFAIEHDVQEILVDGFRPDKYVAAIVEEYERDKELYRVQKQLERRQGTAGSTTTKRTMTPVKPFGIQQPPSTTTIQRKRSISCSKISAITPVRAEVNGPKTSSPIKPLLFSASNPQTKSSSKPLQPKNSRPWIN